MSNHVRKMNRIKDDNLRKSWQAWLLTIERMPLGQRLTIAYRIVPGLRHSARICVMLAVAVVMLVVALIKVGVFSG